MNKNTPDQEQFSKRWTNELELRAQAGARRPYERRRAIIEFAVFTFLVISTAGIAWALCSKTGFIVACVAWCIAVLLFNHMTKRGNC